MPVSKTELDAYLRSQGVQVMDGITVENSLLKIIPLVTNPLSDLLRREREDFIGRNFKGRTIPLDVEQNFQKEQKVARAYDTIIPLVVLMSLGIHESIGRAPKREIDMEFKTVPLVPSDEMGYLGRARIYIVWGDKIGLTEDDRKKLLAPLKTHRRLPWMKRAPEEQRDALAADFNQVRITIWPEQTRLDYVPETDSPDFAAVSTDELSRNPKPLVTALQASFNNPQHFRITAHRVA